MSTLPRHHRHPGLLPDGFRDVLHPSAWQAETVRRQFLDHFHGYGYDLVSPPLAEFEGGDSAADSQRGAFRLMDKESQHLMVLRSDITPQIMRLVSTRLDGMQRPLRLCYAGEVLRSKGTQLRPARQFQQLGVELVGSTALDAEAEVILLGAEALLAAGVVNLSVDLTLPALPDQLIAAARVDSGTAALMLEALDRRDAAAITALDPEDDTRFAALLAASGEARAALDMLRGLDLKGDAGRLVARVGRLVDMLQAHRTDIQITLDPCERRGFTYQNGIAFGYFAVGHSGELGRGGRYSVPGQESETATGFSLYLDRILDQITASDEAECVYGVFGLSAARKAALRADGYRVIAALAAGDDHRNAAHAGCQWIADETGLYPVETE